MPKFKFERKHLCVSQIVVDHMADETEQTPFITTSQDVEQPYLPSHNQDLESRPLRYTRHAYDTNGVPWISSLFNLTNTAIGAGSLALPYVLHQCGLVIGLFLIMFVAIFSWFSLYFLTVARNLSRKKSFIGVAQAAYGSRGEKVASLAMFLLLLGPLSAYFQICGMLVLLTTSLKLIFC